jgi:ATP-dependent Clp protease ATP-binding subunit ClpA
VEPDHLLLALVREQEGVARTLLERSGASVLALEPALVSAVERFPKVSGAGQPYPSAALNKSLEQAEKEAGRLKDEYRSPWTPRAGSSRSTGSLQPRLQPPPATQLLANRPGRGK